MNRPVQLDNGLELQVKPAPLLIYLHGGCWFLNANFDSHDVFCRRLANQAACVVLAVDYRLVPSKHCSFAALLIFWSIYPLSDLQRLLFDLKVCISQVEHVAVG